MSKPNQIRIIVVLLLLLFIAAAASVGMTIYGNQKSREVAFLGLEINRLGTLYPAGIFALPRTQTPGIFEPTLTAIARLNAYKPVVKDFDDLSMVEVPVGCFFMGSILSARLQPVSEQCFETAFWIGETEITNIQYKAFIDDGGYNNQAYWTKMGWAWRNDSSFRKRTQPLYWNQPRFNKTTQPVVGISWYEALAYTTWLTARYHTAGLISADQVVRLPTESEWEYAARGPNDLKYSWGNDWIAITPVTDNSRFTEAAPDPVGSIPIDKSWVGALDMDSNVWEWMNSIYAIDRPREFRYPYRMDDGREAKIAAYHRAIRGSTLSSIGSAFRYSVDQSNVTNDLGFRVVISFSLPGW